MLTNNGEKENLALESKYYGELVREMYLDTAKDGPDDCSQSAALGRRLAQGDLDAYVAHHDKEMS